MSSLKPGFGRLATIGEVFGLLDDHLPVLGAERVGLSDSLHRALARAVVAEVDVPHFAKAAMDGYAVRAEDTFGATDSRPRELEVAGVLLPGDLPTLEAGPGQGIEIGTGAPLPPGADSVVMVEYTEPAGDGTVFVRKPVAPGENVIGVGSDVTCGDPVLSQGQWLEPRHLGVLAAIGLSEVEVVRRPVAGLFSTGPELIPAGGALEPGRIFDVNYHTLAAALTADGCEVAGFGIVEDDPEALDMAIARSLESCDFLVLSGGSSLGGGDLVEGAFSRAGKVVLHGVAVKPGKPVVLGTARGPVPDGSRDAEKMLIGLPGYPMSALSDYYIFVRPFIRRAMGIIGSPSYLQAELARKHPSTVGRYEFLPVRLEGNLAIPLTKGSSAISALAEADGFVEIDENTEVVAAGDSVRVRLF